MSTNGDALPDDIPRIVQALEAIHNPRSSNDVRREATTYLEQAKQSPHALSHGFSLASDPTRATVLRHFGLSMMTFHLKYIYQGGAEDLLREYALRLTESLRDTDPAFLRNKIAQIWTEVVKRIWGPSWQDMDEQLVNLWNASSPLYSDFVLTVLETLSEDIFNQEDYVAGLRADLGSAFARTCITESLIEQHYDKPDEFSALRFGKEGWLQRICTFLRQYLDRLASQDAQAQTAALKAFSTLQSICPWIPPKCLISASCVETMSYALVVGDTAIRTAATEALCCIFARVNVDNDDMSQLLSPMFSSESLKLLQDAFQWAGTATPDEDDAKYGFAKKLSELLTCFGSWVEGNPAILQSSGNVVPFFQLFLDVSKHPSLLVSLPLLQIWLRLLRNRTPEFSELVEVFIGSLLELCSQRSIRYDILPEDSGDISLMFLAADCDNATQRDMILQQYRQACVGVIEQIVRKVPIEAIKHILSEAANFFQGAKDVTIDPNTYDRSSQLSLQGDAYFTTVEAGTRGCLKWLAVHIDSNPDVNKATEQKAEEIRSLLSEWCQTSLEIPLRDPDMKKKLIAQSISISCKVLPANSPSALTVLDHLLNVRSEKIPASAPFTESTKDLVETCAYASQRLATVFADQYLPIYDQLESRIQEIIRDEGYELQPAYFAFLIMIIHRASNLDGATRTEKLRRMILPVRSAWQDARLVEGAGSYEAFCKFLGWEQLPDFLSSQGFEQTKDWSDRQLTESGRQFQVDLLQRNEQVPIKLTKAILKATTDKVEEGSPIWEVSCALWAEVMPDILPNLLKMLNYATIFQNPEQWQNIPPQLQSAMKKLLQDRFWQSGISNETRDAFVSRVTSSKNSFEGFGSTVRRTIRQVRVGSCDLLLLFSKLGEAFYGIPDLAPPMSEALFESSHALTAHHFSVLVTFSSQLISACPMLLARQFLPPIIAKLFIHLRYKIDSEWDAVNRRTEEASDDDNLDDEMKNQSILRSMTYNGCYLLFVLLKDHHKDVEKDGSSANPLPTNPDTLFNIITTSDQLLEPIFLFTASALRVRDSHSVSCVLTVLRDLVPQFRATGPVHTFICNDLLKAAITSLHEPYFVDQQRDLATLIVIIIHLDPTSALSILGSLPGLSAQPDKVRIAIERVVACAQTSKTARAVVLDLLEQIRGVSIHEMGKIGGPTRKSKGAARLLQQLELQGQQHGGQDIERGSSPGLEGVADLMGGGDA